MKMHRIRIVTIAALLAAVPQMLASRACAGTPTSKYELERRVAEAARMLADRPRLKGMSQAQREKHVEFVVGNLLFVLGHETGHAVIREMGVPVVGREEDAADIFSTLMALTCEEGFGDRGLANAALGWFLSDRRDRRDQRRRDQGAEANYYDEHGMDLQRAYNVVCLMVGSNPGKFATVADAAKLPPERQTTCQDDYLNAKWSWDQVLQSHLRKPDQAQAAINIVYGPGNGKYDAHAAVSQQMKLLETVAESLSDRFAWRAPISLEMQTCGEPNARFEFRTKKVIVCYELADEFSDLYSRYGRAMSLSLDAKVSTATPGRANIAPLASRTEITLRPPHRTRPAFTTVATAGPRGQVPESLHYIDRASQNHDNGGN
jgi:Putative metallopeptidase